MGVVCYTAVGKRNAVFPAARPKHSQSHFSLSLKLISNLCENPVGFVRLYPESDPFHHSHSHQSSPSHHLHFFPGLLPQPPNCLPSACSLHSSLRETTSDHVAPLLRILQRPAAASHSFPVSLSLAGSIADSLASFLLLGSASGPAFMAPFYLEHSCPDGCMAYTLTSVQS